MDTFQAADILMDDDSDFDDIRGVFLFLGYLLNNQK